MTNIYHDGIDFEQWYYKNDPTHVFIYTHDTFDYIKNEFGFSELVIEGNLITFVN